MGEPVVISYFDAFEGSNEWAFLSNFWEGAQPLRFKGREYRTGEHMFQAFKATTKGDHERIAGMGTAAEAKAEGKHYLRLRQDWERVKYDVMRLVLATKFRLDREEGGLLLATGDALLVEGTMWGDKVWGVDLKRGRAEIQDSWSRAGRGEHPAWEPGEGWEHSPGRNWLGTLLMARRVELYAQQRGAAQLDYGETARVAMELPPRR